MDPTCVSDLSEAPNKYDGCPWAKSTPRLQHGRALCQRGWEPHRAPYIITEQCAVERLFENATQAGADFTQHSASTEVHPDGDTSKDAIRILRGEAIIAEETTDTLVAAVGVRNVLAHEYGTVDYGEVYEHLQTGLDVCDAFSRQLAQWIREQE